MYKRICPVCHVNFDILSPYKLLCSKLCRKNSAIRSRKKYKGSDKWIASEKRWQKNPKKKEIFKKHMAKPEAKAVAVKRMKRLESTVPYYQFLKKLKSSIAYKEIRKELILKFGRCFKCSIQQDLTIDHIHPLSMGGKHEIDNLQVLCRSCNASKKQETIRYAVPQM